MNIFYFIKEALRGFYQAKLMTFVSVLTIGCTLFFLGCVGVSYVNIRLWLKNAANRVEAVVYVKDAVAADSAALAACVASVRQCKGVVSASVVNKADAWNRFRDMYGSAMLEAVDENPLPASIELTLSERHQSATETEKLRAALVAIGGVEDVQMSLGWVLLLEKIRNYFLVATFILGIVLIVALHFMIANTIKLTIYGRRELVRNMQYVGATNAYITAPFILEGILQGLAGSALGVAGLLVVKMSLSRLPIVWGHWYFVFLLFPIGALFGWIGSSSAVRRFLAS